MKQTKLFLILVSLILLIGFLFTAAYSSAGQEDYLSSEGSSQGYSVPKKVVIEAIKGREARLKKYKEAGIEHQYYKEATTEGFNPDLTELEYQDRATNTIRTTESAVREISVEESVAEDTSVELDANAGGPSGGIEDTNKIVPPPPPEPEPEPEPMPSTGGKTKTGSG